MAKYNWEDLLEKVRVLNEGDIPLRKACKKVGISYSSYHSWRHRKQKKYKVCHECH